MADVAPAGLSQTAVQALITSAVNALNIPQPAIAAPPGVADTGAAGNIARYALENHTHASKARKARVQSAADGTLTWTFSPPFGAGVVPIISAVAEAATGVADVINVQVVDTPTNTGCKLLVNRTQRSVVALLGLTLLSVPSSPGVTWVHAVALEP